MTKSAQPKMVYQEEEASLCGAAGVACTVKVPSQQTVLETPDIKRLGSGSELSLINDSLSKIKDEVRLNSRLHTPDFLLGGGLLFCL